MQYYLAIDIGASSGRHILGYIEDNQLKLEEVYRFKNNVTKIDGHYGWDVNYLFESILNGIKECVSIGKVPSTMGIDTWAVDYVLLDKDGRPLTNAFAYRDKRNEQGVQKVCEKISKEQLYMETGIQFQAFNSIYQLNSYNEDVLKDVVDYLMIPDYFHYLLTGNKVNEYTNMSTTQMLDIKTNQLHKDLLKRLNIPTEIFKKMVMPTESIGYFTKEIQEKVGCNIEVIAPATHDTGSAYMASVEIDSIILSSGTWSLLGVETKTPFVSKETQQANFTNEGGYDYHYRFLKNIMGLWIIQEVSRNLDEQYSFATLVEMAKTEPFYQVFDVNVPRFLKPDCMITEIQNYFKERGQTPPETVGEIASCVYYSLAHCYKESIEELEKITKKVYCTINIIGGGCQNQLLNEMIADVTGKKVVAGPIEATALGNLLSQLIAKQVVSDLFEGRELIRRSFPVNVY